MSLLQVKDLSVHFPITRGALLNRTVGHVRAVDDVSFSIPRHGAYGLVGESGCGKSTLGRAIMRLNTPTSGTVTYDGTDLTALSGRRLRGMRRHVQMVFQDPMSSLDPRQNVEMILLEGLNTHKIGSGTTARRALVADALDAVGLPRNSLSRYPHEFSGGQRQRIGIARALIVQPDLIVADEPVSALDVSIQAQILNLLADLQASRGLTYLIIAHDLAVVRHVSQTVGVMYLGSLVEEADSDDLYATPMHPYTRALVSAVPVPDPDIEDRRERIILKGDLPSASAPPSGCRFHTRCPWVRDTRCRDERPLLRTIATGPANHRVACHFAEEIHTASPGPQHPDQPA